MLPSPPPPKNYKISSAFSYNFKSALTEIFVRKVAPLGDPMELNVRGYELSVRKGDAEMIEVEA